MTLRIPHAMIWDDRLDASDAETIDMLNATCARLNEMRALEINISGPFLRSKIAWKLATYQHGLLHRVIALMDGVALAWNDRATLPAMLSARALMETFALFCALDTDLARHLAAEDIGRLDALAQNGNFATRDEELLEGHLETRATNILTFIARYDRRVPGFRAHYDRMSERCHPNALGHHFMFSTFDEQEGSVTYSDETNLRMNADLIMGAILLLPLIEDAMNRLNDSVLAVSELDHRLAPLAIREEDDKAPSASGA